MSAAMEAMLNRRSCRKFKSDMIPHPVLEEIVRAGTYAATGMGKQSPIIIAVTNRAMRDRLSAMNAAVLGKGAENDPLYPLPFGKIQDASTTLIERRHLYYLGGCYIDIFPYDAYPDNVLARRWQCIKYHYLKQCLIKRISCEKAIVAVAA